MIGSLTANNMHMLESSLNFLWTKQATIADNVANVETPNYKAKYVQFEDVFKANIQNAASENNKGWEMSQVLQNTTPTTYVAETEFFTSDNNGVDVAEQEIEALRNNYQMQYVLTAITNDFNLLRTAIKAQ